MFGFLKREGTTNLLFSSVNSTFDELLEESEFFYMVWNEGSYINDYAFLDLPSLDLKLFIILSFDYEAFLFTLSGLKN